ncbi:MAG: hypothetical protein R3E89_11245, partial [Thiolinea sp.]
MLQLQLYPHPGDTRIQTPSQLLVRLERTAHLLKLEYRLQTDTAHLLIPAAQPPQPRDGLWQHTCFE